ncbi:hypothetical protein [Paenibacillus dendritiformis]|nr:hypothetical protein [Paenibacillus dendritiformis]
MILCLRRRCAGDGRLGRPAYSIQWSWLHRGMPVLGYGAPGVLRPSLI